MTIADRIMKFAVSNNQPFRRRDLLQALVSDSVSTASAHVQLNRLVEQGKLTKIGFGLYSLPKNDKPDFIYKPSEEEKNVALQLKEKFPLVDFCVWKPSVLVSYMQHIPAVRMTFVDVERVAMESVFYFLQELFAPTPVLLNPTAIECERYITNEEMVIVRLLVNEAPIMQSEDTPVPTLEKILVDAAGDKELLFAQGAEYHTIFENAMEAHNVNTRRLLRYASRRNRKESVQRMIKPQQS